jgi:hypothetical protein
MSAADTGLIDIAASVAAESAPVVETPVETTVDSGVTETVDAPVVESGAEAETETETRNTDGTEKTPAQQAAFREAAAAKAGKDPLPTEVRGALKQLRDSAPDDQKIQAAVKTLHGAYERWNAAKPMLGQGGVNSLRDFLSETGAKDITEARAAYSDTLQHFEAVKAADELLYSANPQLWKNVLEDLKASGHPEAFGKLAGSFIAELKAHDVDAYYNEVSKPTVLSGLEEAGFAGAYNRVLSMLNDGKVAEAKAALQSIGKWFTDLRNELSETSKISKERERWESEKAEAAKGETAKATKAWESSVATDADAYNNTALGKALAPFLVMPFFKDFPRETKIDLGNGIKAHLYATLRSDKAYQTQMSALWKGGNTPANNAKIQAYHKQTLDRIAQDIVTRVVQNRYPGYAKGGSAAGRVAAAAAKKATDAKASAASVTSGKPIYVASKPKNIMREDITVNGRLLTPSDLQVLEISGKGYVKTTDGKAFKLVTWRR